MPRPIAGFLLDLDGTLYTGDRAVPGAARTLDFLRSEQIPFRLVTNTSSRPRADVIKRLRDYGIPADANEVITAPLAAAAVLRERGHRTIAPFLNDGTLADLAGLQLVGGTAKGKRGAGSGKRETDAKVTAILVGDLGRTWNYDLLQEAYTYLRDGAQLFACSRDRVYRAQEGLVLDAGPFVAALEYAANCAATITGKPSPAFYRAAIARLGAGPKARVVMVGDDLHTDVRGAQEAGAEGWLVLSGKTSRAALLESGVKPDGVLESVAQLEAEWRKGGRAEEAEKAEGTERREGAS